MPQQKKPGRKKSRIKDRRRVADHYTLQARKQDYPARSIFKLKEIDQKYQIVKQGYRVLDLGTTPGSWAKYAAQKVGSGGRVIGVDLNSPDIEYTDPMRFIQADVSETAPDLLIKEGPFDLVLSDMAPKTTGHKNVDQIKSAQLVMAAFQWAQTLLKPGGTFIFKIFQGNETDGVFREIEPFFKALRRVKPKSSRKISPEIFGVGLGFKNRQNDSQQGGGPSVGSQ
jgi:23S rRNA (uridine2552-2'-O)-methyltransferase